ncbi:M23 family metallopeptidase [Arthrobacter rhombi]|uniref:M23 family metallopeptidase n=1 Tax=Arthrobacter rhombi TaxID=71253 RepID=UPI003FD4BB86
MPLPRAFRWPVVVVLSMALLVGGGSASPAGPAEARGADAAAGTGQWSWPLGGPEALMDPFAAPPAPWAAGHRGVDLRAGAGTGVDSPADGVVRFSGVVVDRQVLTIDHGGGLVSSFEPVVTELTVGTRVVSGQQVASVGAGGHCAGLCLHWGVRLKGDYIDPLSLLMDRRPSILLPVPEGASRRGLDRRPRA